MKRFYFLLIIVLALNIISCEKTGYADNNPYISESDNLQVSNTSDAMQNKDDPPVFSESVYDILSEMSVEEKVGQIFLARCPTGRGVEEIKKYKFGGYILFGRDFEEKTSDVVIETIASYQNASSIPMIIAVDEEGGTVCRVSNNPELRIWEFPSPRSLFKIGGMERIINDETEKSLLLKSLGINVNMAPVCDITTDKKAFMYERSLGKDKTLTSEFISNFVSINNLNQVGCVLKHFPGYGNNGDTHKGMIVDDRSLVEFENNDLVPFKAGIESGAPAILMSHTIVKCFDENYPTSLSVKAHDYLRKNMGFRGVIITDDLVMDAIKEQYGTGEAAVLAVLAGNDLLCSSEYDIQFNAVLEAVNSGRISEEHLDISVCRVLEWKFKLGLVE